MGYEGEDTQVFFEHSVSFNFTLFTPRCPSEPLLPTMTARQALAPFTTHFTDLFLTPDSHPHAFGCKFQRHVFPVMLLLLLCARTSVNESRSTRTALLHAILPDLLENPPPQGKICHRSLICWKRIRKYVKCSKNYIGVCSESVERIPVRSQCAGSRFQQLTRRELSAGGKAIHSDYLQSSSTPSAFLSGYIHGDSADEHCPNEGCKSTGSNWTGLWDYRTDYRTIIGQKSQPLAIDALE